MTDNKTAIVYIAYGPIRLHKQVILSILTLYYFLNETEGFEKINLVVYTDDKEIFEENLKGIIINYEILTPQNIKEYIGAFNHIHRLKICVIKDCMQKYKNNILYIDGDTYILKSPWEIINKISSEATVFHIREFKLTDGSGYTWDRTLKLVKKYKFELQGEEFKIDIDAEMWNAGTIGISLSNFRLLDDVLQLTDDISKKSSFFLAEQFAFSYIFLKNTTIIPANDFVYHYWYPHLKEMYSFYINKFLEENKSVKINSMAEEAMKLTRRQNELPLPKGTKKDEFKKKLKKMKKYKESDIDFFMYHLRLRVKNKFRSYLPSAIKSKN